MEAEGDNFLTDSERAYFREFESMFESTGWRQLSSELELEVKDLPERAFHNAKCFEDIQTARAKVVAVQEVLTFSQELELRKQHLIVERQQEAADIAEETYGNV